MGGIEDAQGQLATAGGTALALGAGNILLNQMRGLGKPARRKARRRRKR